MYVKLIMSRRVTAASGEKNEKKKDRLSSLPSVFKLALRTKARRGLLRNSEPHIDPHTFNDQVSL